MNLTHVAPHFIFPRKRLVPRALTPITVFNDTPKGCLFDCMSAVVMSVKVDGAIKCSSTTGSGALEDAPTRITGTKDDADAAGRLHDWCCTMFVLTIHRFFRGWSVMRKNDLLGRVVGKWCWCFAGQEHQPK